MSDRPNVLFFMPDAVQARLFRPDHPCVTPNMERLARRGVSFRRAVTPLPTCSPARASCMTGLLPHNHGVLQVEHCVDADQCVVRPDKPHWAQRLVAAGYRTGYFGKWHVERNRALEDFGWQESVASHCRYDERFHRLVAALPDEKARIDQDRAHWIRGPEGYRDILHCAVVDLPPEERPVSLPVRLAESFLDDALGGGEPWCCAVSFPQPNESLLCGRDAFERHDAASLDLPSTLRDELADRPGLYRREQRIFRDIPEAQWRDALACYYGRVSEVDALFGRLLDRLEDAGELENTLVVVTADHGRYMGDHGFDAHNVGAYESIYDIPLLVAGPGVAEGAETSARVGLQDLCPTILEMTGADLIDVPDSRSFAPVLHDPAGAEGDYTTAFAEYFGTRYPLMQRIFWEDDMKLVFNGFDEDELVDLAADPEETRNLASDPARADTVRRMMRGLWDVVRRTDDRTLLNTHYASMRLAAVGPDAADGPPVIFAT